MNPWEIVSWIGAFAVALLIIAFTIALVAALIKGKTDPTDAALRRMIRKEKQQ